MLATANRPRFIICVIKKLARAGDMFDPVKNFLTSSLITMQNLVAVSHVMCTHEGGPKNFGDAGASPLKTAGVTPRNAPTHMYYHTWLTPRNTPTPHVLPHQIRSLYVKALCVRRMSSKLWDVGAPPPWDVDVAG